MSRFATRVQRGAKRRFARARVSAVSRHVRDEHLTYLSIPELRDLERCAREAPGGDFVECGIALGGSAIVLASKLQDGRSFHGYDVFGMIPAPGPKDSARAHERYRVIASGESQGLAGEEYYGYRDDLYDQVVAAFARHGVPVDGERVVLYRGLFEDTLRPQRPISLAHIDCDWYDPVKVCLERIWPQLVPDGFLLLDDYHSHEGARTAVDEFLAAGHALHRVPWGNDAHLVLRRPA